MADETLSVGRRNLLMRGAGAGAGLALAAVAFGASAQSTPTTTSDRLERARQDVRDAYAKTKQDIDDFGGKVTDATKSTYDDIEAAFDDLGTKLDGAEKLPADSALDVKRAYRDIQHGLDDLDLRMDELESSTDKDSRTGWDDVRKSVRNVHHQVDHVFDAIWFSSPRCGRFQAPARLPGAGTQQIPSILLPRRQAPSVTLASGRPDGPGRR